VGRNRAISSSLMSTALIVSLRTDTDGQAVVSALLVQGLKARYWKPGSAPRRRRDSAVRACGPQERA